MALECRRTWCRSRPAGSSAHRTRACPADEGRAPARAGRNRCDPPSCMCPRELAPSRRSRRPPLTAEPDWKSLANSNEPVTKADKGLCRPGHTIGRLRTFHLTPSLRLWSVTAVLAALGAAGWLGLFHNLGAFTTPRLGWWVFALAFFATERWVVLANPRRGAPAISVSAAPFAVGLFYAAPADLLVGYLVGAAAAAVTRRPLVVALTAFSLARFTLFAALGEGVFRAMPTTAAALDWRGWLAATLAILVVASRRLLVAPTVVIQRTNAALPDAVRRLRLAGMSTATAGCVGLVAVVLIHVQPDALVLLGPVGVAMFAALRAYVRERHQRQIAEFLYGAGDALGSRELESAIV